jgi:hypothetical protein
MTKLRFIDVLIRIIAKTLFFIQIVFRQFFNGKSKIYLVIDSNEWELKKGWIWNNIYHYTKFCEKIDIKVVNKVSLYALFSGRSILVWSNISLLERKIYSRINNMFLVNPEIYISAWDWVYFGNYFTRYESNIQVSKRIFQEAVILARQKGLTSYVFGTGPSLSKVKEVIYSGGCAIVCNTIVKNSETISHLNPSFIVAGDALYHFSLANHAKQFRSDLLLRMKECNAYFVYPQIYDLIIQDEFREVSNRLIPIPQGKHFNIHVNLLEVFELPILGNVLPMLQLPLACTINRSVKLWGFDGRAPYDSVNAFWENSDTHSYSNLITEMQKEFVYFFQHFVPNNDKKSYVESVHGKALEESLRRAEILGYSFEMMHESWTDVFARRIKN